MTWTRSGLGIEEGLLSSALAAVVLFFNHGFPCSCKQ